MLDPGGAGLAPSDPGRKSFASPDPRKKSSTSPDLGDEGLASPDPHREDGIVAWDPRKPRPTPNHRALKRPFPESGPQWEDGSWYARTIDRTREYDSLGRVKLPTGEQGKPRS